MAFRIDANLGYGDGETGNLTAGSAQVVNNYAQVYYISGKAVKITNVSNTGYGTFEAGQEVLIHVAGYKGTATYCKKRGFWRFCKITAVTDNVITLSKDCGTITNGFSIDDLYVQLITVPHFKTLTLDEGKSVTCPQFDPSTGRGGVVVFKCSEELKFNGGHINTRLKGMPDNSYWSKGRVPDEMYDSILRREGGYEHYRTLNHLTINYPDGAALILTKKMTCHDDSRIGNYTLNNDGSRGAVDGDSTTIFGGSSVALVAETIDNWHDKMIQLQSSYTYGQGARGISRCYVATETALVYKKRFFALDVISDPTRMSRELNIKSFGDGSLGDTTNYSYQLNTYANITAIDSSRKVLTIGNISTDGLAKLQVGALVMLHSVPRKYFGCAGSVLFTYITGMNVNTITIADPYPAVNYAGNLTHYSPQIIAVPQFRNFVYNKAAGCAKHVPKYDITKKIGGVMVIAVSETCDIRGGYLNVHSKGNEAIPYGEKALWEIYNAKMRNRLPLGQGHGSVLILANNIIMDEATRIGADDKRFLNSNFGTETGGLYFQGLNRCIFGEPNESGYLNEAYQDANGGAFLYRALSSITKSTDSALKTAESSLAALGKKELLMGTCGGVTTAGECSDGEHNGGYGSNSSDGAQQGSHIMIISNKITGLCLNALCTGGSGGNISNQIQSSKQKYAAQQGGCGYGGSGGSCHDTTTEYRGGNGGILGGGGGASSSSHWSSGGGSAGFCFIYCNEAVEQNTGGLYSG